MLGMNAIMAFSFGEENAGIYVSSDSLTYAQLALCLFSNSFIRVASLEHERERERWVSLE